ncbi:MAG: inositol monophosphatase [Alphaproteobacteria bacterium]|nr:inositol monophosphatase [Alphaproteobacteria bacterium]
MASADDSQLLAAAVDLARRAGEVAAGYASRLGALAIEEKGPLDLVTAADRAVETFLREEIARLYPDDGFFGEELDSSPVRRRRTWVVDPIDGTANFVRGSPRWAVSIGICQDGRAHGGVIHAPQIGRTLAGIAGRGATLDGAALAPLPSERPRSPVCAIEAAFEVPAEEVASIVRFARGDRGMALRFNGASTMALMQVALGHADMHAGIESSSWDFLAGMAIVEAMGGVAYTNRPLGELSGPFRVFCGRAGLAAEWESVIRR